MFRVPEGRAKLRKLVKEVYGDEFSPFPPKFYKDDSKNSMAHHIPLHKRMLYFPHYEPSLSGITE